MASGTPDKVASSRLLTMAFMQRAFAKEAESASASSTPASSKRKMGHSMSRRAAEPSAVFDQEAVNSAVADEEKKRLAALEQRARDLGDSRWVLRDPRNVTGHAVQKPLNIVQVGFSQIDRDDDGSEDDKPAPRLNYNKKPTKSDSEMDSESGSEGSSESDSSSDTEPDDEPDEPRAHKIAPKTLVPSKRRAELAKASKLAEKRRKKEINLNRPVSISARQSRSGPASPNSSNIVCYSCGIKGHTKAKCPRNTGLRAS